MLGRVDIDETIGPGGQIRHGFFGDVGRMVVQNHPDDRLFWVMIVQALEKRNELPASRRGYSDDRSGLHFRSPEGGVFQVDLLVDHQDFGHLPVELQIPLLHVIPDPMRFDVGDIEDPPDYHPGIFASLGKPAASARS